MPLRCRPVCQLDPGPRSRRHPPAGTIREQLKEAGAIAPGLLYRQGWSDTEIANSLRDCSNRFGNNSWSEQVDRMAARLDNYKAADTPGLAQLLSRRQRT